MQGVGEADHDDVRRVLKEPAVVPVPATSESLSQFVATGGVEITHRHYFPAADAGDGLDVVRRDRPGAKQCDSHQQRESSPATERLPRCPAATPATPRLSPWR